MEQGYEVELDVFKGPLDLLLHLIEKNKIDIYDIPIALLTEQYLEYLARFEALDMEIASEFIVMAATLLQIKSRILLPRQLTANVELEDDDPRQELVERLLEYKRFQQVTVALQDMAKEQGRSFYRTPLAAEVPIAYAGTMDIKLLWQAFQKMLQKQGKSTFVQRIAKEAYTVADKIAEIEARFQQSKESTLLFTDFFAINAGKDELVATFLALLELIRLKKITVCQNSLFAAIKIQWKDVED